MDAQKTAKPEQINSASTDESALLVARAIAGDREAFGALLAQHYDFIFRVAFRWSGRREEAEDVAQDVCVKLAHILPSFEFRSSFQSWLYSIVINAARDVGRKAARRAELVPEHLDDLGLSATDDSAALAEKNDLWRSVRRLPPRQADAILLVYGEQRTHAEAAQILGCTEKTVSWHIHEAKKALRSLL